MGDFTLLPMRILGAALPLILLGGCVSPVPPAPTPAPVARPKPAPPPPPAPVAADWRDIPLTPGDWVYLPDARGSSAMFGRPGVEADFILRCDLASRTVTLSWPGQALGGAVTITTSFGAQGLTVGPVGGTARVGTTLVATDPLLDRMAFSRGRFTLTGVALGDGRLVIPAWPEAARAIEDCRK